MNPTAEYQRIALELLKTHGGHMRVAEVVTRAVMPSVHVRPTFAALIAARKVILQGDDNYVLVDPSAPAQQPRPAMKPTTTPTAPAPAAATEKPPPQRRCVRCEELKPHSEFPMRPGMVRAPRICSDCLPANEKPNGENDRERQGLDAKPDLVPFTAPGPAAPPPPPNMEPVKPLVAGLATALSKSGANIDAGDELVVTVSKPVRAYLEQLTATGLWGASVEATALMMIQNAVRAAIVAEGRK